MNTVLACIQIMFDIQTKMMAYELKKPGEIAQRSGQYEITGPRGGGMGEERTITKGEPLPPTPQVGQRYKLVDPTKHKGSK